MLPRIYFCVVCILLCTAVYDAASAVSLSTTTNTTLQISPAVNITADIQTKTDQTDVQIEQKKLARKALRRKRKRLRKLREQVRLLRAQLFHESNAVDPATENENPVFGDESVDFSQPTIADSVNDKQRQKLGSRPGEGKLNGKKMGGNVKWRRRIMKQLALVIKRLDRLELQDKKGAKQPPSSNKKLSRKELREDRRRRRQQMRLRKFIDKTNGRAVDAPAGKKKKRPRIDSTAIPNPSTKLDKLHSSINQSLSGDQGGPCIAHRDCKPGLCCHSSTTNNGTSKFCVLHGFLNGVQCDDSCQCSAGLHCFKVANDPAPADVQFPQPPTEQEHLSSHVARCKKASTEDVLHGVYLNAKDGAFNTLPFP